VSKILPKCTSLQFILSRKRRGVTSSVTVQPHFLEEEQLDTATVTAQSYRETLENIMAAGSRHLYTRDIWFNKVTTSHIYLEFLYIFCETFLQGDLSLDSEVLFGLNKLDMTDPSPLKVRVLQTRTVRLYELKTRVREEISLIQRNVYERQCLTYNLG
jgi:hypothetical protein